MKGLYKFYLLYLYYFGSFWGYVTFTYDESLHKFVPSRKMVIWNRIMTAAVFLTFVETIPLLFENALNTQVSSFRVFRNDSASFLIIVAFLYILAISSSTNEKLIRLAGLSRSLYNSIGFLDDAETKISKSFTLIFLNDMGAYVTIIYLIKKHIELSDFHIMLLASMNYFLLMGFKLLTTSYIFALFSAAQLIRKINSDIDQVLTNNDTISIKSDAKLTRLAQLYEEVINFVKMIHSFVSFILLLTFLSNLQEILDGVSFFQLKILSSTVYRLQAFDIVKAFVIHKDLSQFYPIIFFIVMYYTYQTYIVSKACITFKESVSWLVTEN